MSRKCCTKGKNGCFLFKKKKIKKSQFLVGLHVESDRTLKCTSDAATTDCDPNTRQEK